MSQQKNNQVEQLLAGVTNKQVKEKPEIIYGIAQRRGFSMFSRINDFFIDHSKVKLEEKVYFFHLLAVMIDAGVPLIQALKILANRTKSERFRRILNTIGYSVTQGKNFSEAMARFPDVFGDMEVGIVRSGEAAGNLDKMLFKLSDQLDKSHALQIKVITSSIYPIAVLVVLVLVASAMLIWVVPSLVNLLTESGMQEKDFPLATQILLHLSRFLTGYWWAVIIGVFFVVMFFRVYISSDNGKFRWDYFKLRFPVIGSLLRRVIVLRFIGNLGILIESGLPVVQALTILASSTSNELYRLKMWQVIARVQQGEKISTSLADSSFLFPETVTQMLAVGEQSAMIGPISEKIAEHYDREVDNALKRLTSLLEPIMIVFVGLTVAVLALAVLMPIFNLGQLVS